MISQEYTPITKIAITSCQLISLLLSVRFVFYALVKIPLAAID